LVKLASNNHMDQDQHLSFLKARGESGEYLKKCPDIDFFKTCVQNDILDNVTDWKLLTRSYKILKANPFTKEHFGEGLDYIISARNKLSVIYNSDFSLSLQNKMNFYVWVFFETKKNNVYVPYHIVSPFCMKYKIDLEDFFEYLVRHALHKNLFTSRDIRNNETSIEKWLHNANVLYTDFNNVMELDEQQNITIQKVMTSKFSIIQGNAGCGKTTSICEMLKQINSNKKIKIFAAAFTHKAKKCIEARLRSAGLDNVVIGTVHSVIGIMSSMAETGSSEDIFIVLDEASMLDIELLGTLANTMLASAARYQVCFVGDYFQIQPVGRGELFRQLVEDDKDVVCKLLRCYRTDKEDLFQAYENLRKGNIPSSSDHFKIEYKESDQDISSFVGKFINKHHGAYQIIAWQNKHLGMLNSWVQKALVKANKIGPGHFKRGMKEFYVNDKVIYCGENSEDLTNSMNGIIVNVDSKGVWIKWEHKSMHSVYKDTYGIYLAYAISAHKSQGSEYNNVLVVCYEVEKMCKCLDRRWLYTSCTRGQENVVVVTTKHIDGFVNKQLSKIPIHNTNIDYELCANNDE
jgi:hypothetical protein